MALMGRKYSPSLAYWYLQRKRRLNLTPGGAISGGGFWLINDQSLYLTDDAGAFLIFEV